MPVLSQAPGSRPSLRVPDRATEPSPPQSLCPGPADGTPRVDMYGVATSTGEARARAGAGAGAARDSERYAARWLAREDSFQRRSAIASVIPLLWRSRRPRADTNGTATPKLTCCDWPMANGAPLVSARRRNAWNRGVRMRADGSSVYRLGASRAFSLMLVSPTTTSWAAPAPAGGDESIHWHPLGVHGARRAGVEKARSSVPSDTSTRSHASVAPATTQREPPRRGRGAGGARVPGLVVGWGGRHRNARPAAEALSIRPAPPPPPAPRRRGPARDEGWTDARHAPLRLLVPALAPRALLQRAASLLWLTGSSGAGADAVARRRDSPSVPAAARPVVGAVRQPAQKEGPRKMGDEGRWAEATDSLNIRWPLRDGTMLSANF